MTGTNKYVSVAGTGIRFSHLIRHIYDKYYRRTRANYAERPLPVASLLALALAGFITILTETLPAGLLPQISAGMNISGAMAGQFVTLYAVGSLVAAIP
ncbi:putative arabinose transporter [Leclercia adecarboxylata]|uniref:Putative arabinose transporter n=1 Tax=Leclercia adecarboxylata TaxID=83655 RepID=A0A4U9HTZ6_9ENTR|nr:putative arabinose transporter [Leclercia adecarboxylata]